MAARQHTDILWRKYFSDPSQWWDNRYIKSSSKSPDFKHKTTQESLWIDGWNNSSWVREELRKRGISTTHEELCVEKEQNGKDFRATCLSFVASLKACAQTKDLFEGSKLHAALRMNGLLEKNPYLGSTLISMYAKCGALIKAQEVLNELPVRDVVSWSVLIAGYAQQGQGKVALDCCERMRSEGLSPNAITYASMLKACGITREVEKGKQFHDEIVSQGLLERNVVLGTALVDMYAKCGVLTKAQEVLNELPVRDVVSWSALITGYVQQGQGEEALQCYMRMRREGLSPNAITYACILKACGITQDVDKGKEFHDEIVSRGLLGKDVVLGTALVDMYVKCGMLMKAQQVLDELPNRNVVSWSALIAGYSEQGQGKEALGCYEMMRREGLSPNAVTYACILKACGITKEVDRGKQIHDEIVSQGLLRENIILGTALVDMYAKCGALTKAQQALDELPVRNIVSWSALIAGYVEQGQGKEALECYERMQCEGISPNAVTYACILKACGVTKEVDKGKKIHDEIVNGGLVEKHLVLGTALVDMYAKCGVFKKAQQVLDELPVRDVVSWNALVAGYAQQGQGDEAMDGFHRMRSEGITPDIFSWNALIGGYAQQGKAEEALGCFQWMQREGISPDAITFVCVLNACSHSGLVDEGQMYYENMKKIYGITPDIKHQVCMIDLFGRAGHFDRAMTVIERMPSSDHLPVWSSLLGSCRKWGNVKLGKFAFQHAVQLDKRDAAAYVCMEQIYAAAGMQKEAGKIEAMRVKSTAWKQPGRSWWIDDLCGELHSFVVGDTKHAQRRHIYAKLQDITLRLSRQGYSPSLHWAPQDIADDAKRDVLCGHSEKLAVACALINTPQGKEIRIIKNMRVCGDCHAATALISKLESRKIMIKDANRLHIFEDGKCSCGDYW